MEVDFSALLIVFLTCTNVSGRRRNAERVKNKSENEIIEKTQISLRYPNYFVQVRVASPRISFGSARRIHNSVEPIMENCRSSNFTKPYAELKKQVKCKPRDTVVDLIPPTGVIITPNAVIVKRCGGMCNGYKRCISKKTQDAKFYVRTIEKQETSCNSVIVPEDVECRCACKITKSDCLPSQVYNPVTCSCNCKINKDYEECVERSNTKWDEDSCTCSCAHRNTCTTGTIWIPEQCRCAKAEDYRYLTVLYK